MKAMKLSLLFLIPAYASTAQNLKLNGIHHATIIQGDTLHLDFNFEAAGDTALYKIYIDANKNGILDTTDLLITWGKFCDGSFLDEDETKNGIYNQTFKQTGWLPNAALIFAVKDKGVTGTALLDVQQPTSNFTVYGHVETYIAMHDYMVVSARYIDSVSKKTDTICTLTDNVGNYSIAVPDSLGNLYWNVLSGDFLARVKGILAPINPLPLLVNGHVKEDFNYSVWNSTLHGHVKDDAGSMIHTDFLPIWAWGGSPSQSWLGICYTSSGLYNMLLRTGNWFVQPQVGSLYPEYLQPKAIPITSLTTPINQDLICYKADISITGHIYIDGGGADGIRVWAEDTIMTGTTWTGSFTDGRYELLVSSKADSYRLWINPNDIPGDYESRENYIWAKPGVKGIDFHLISTSIAELPKPSLIPSLFIILPEPVRNFFRVKFSLAKAGVVSFKLYDANGRLVKTLMHEKLTSGSYTKKLLVDGFAPGVYFIELKRDCERETRKLLILK